MQRFFSNLFNELNQGNSIAYATILSKRGSTPQVPGASALFNEAGLIHGTLGGGIMEAEVEKISKITMKWAPYVEDTPPF